MVQRINDYFNERKEYGPVFIRLTTGFHLVYGVQDNVLSWQRMVEFRNFLALHHFPFPMASAVVSVYAQPICGLLFIAGAYTRIAAMVMIVNFLAAFHRAHE